MTGAFLFFCVVLSLFSFLFFLPVIISLNGLSDMLCVGLLMADSDSPHGLFSSRV